MSAKELRQELTNVVIEKLRRGIPPSRLLWDPDQCARPVPQPLRANGQPYRGGNALRLMFQALISRFGSPYWLTAIQADRLGAEIRDGQHGTAICFSGSSTKVIKAKGGEPIEKVQFFERSYVVFNADQCRGLPLSFHAEFCRPADLEESATVCGRFFKSVGAKVRYGERTAYYDCRRDLIGMPSASAFIDDESFASVMCHEHVHWTGHHSRLDRGLEESRFGDPEYASEELIAELGAAFLCSELRITPLLRDDHVSYLGFWLAQLERDERAIYVAANRASDAVDFLRSFQPQSVTTH